MGKTTQNVFERREVSVENWCNKKEAGLLKDNVKKKRKSKASLALNLQEITFRTA